MNKFLKYIIFFLLGIVLYYFLMQTIQGQKVVEGFNNANITNFFGTGGPSNTPINIYIPRELTGISKTGEGKNEFDVNSVQSSGGINSESIISISYSALLFNPNDNSIGYLFRPDVYLNRGSGADNSGDSELRTVSSQAITQYKATTISGINNVYPVILNNEHIEAPTTLNINLNLISQGNGDVDTSIERKLNLVDNADLTQLKATITSIGSDVLSTYMDDNITNKLFYTYTVEDSAANTSSPVMIIEFKDTQGSNADLNGPVEITFINFITFLSVTEENSVIDADGTSNANRRRTISINIGDTIDSEDTTDTIDTLVQSLQESVKFTKNSLFSQHPYVNSDDDVLKFQTTINDIYNIDQPRTQDKIKTIVINSISAISQTEYNVIQESDVSESVMTNAGTLRSTLYEIKMNIFNDTDIGPINCSLDFSSFSDIGTSTLDANSYDIGNVSYTNDLPKEITLNPQILDAKFNLFAIISKYGQENPLDVTFDYDSVGNLESALLLSMRSIGTNEFGGIDPPVGCGRLGQEICEYWNAIDTNAGNMPKYWQIKTGGDANDPNFTGCNPHGLGQVASWQTTTSGQRNCYEEPNICCISQQCGKLLRAYPNFCSKHNKHNNPYGQCRSINSDTLGAESVYTSCNECCGMPIHSAITELFYNIYNFNYNNTNVSMTNNEITVENIRDFIYGQLIKSIDGDGTTPGFSSDNVNYDTSTKVVTREDKGLSRIQGILNSLVGNIDYVTPNTQQLTNLNDAATGGDVVDGSDKIIVFRDANDADVDIMTILNKIHLHDNLTTAVTDNSDPDHVKILNDHLLDFITVSVSSEQDDTSGGTDSGASVPPSVSPQKRRYTSDSDDDFNSKFGDIYNNVDNNNLAGRVGLSLTNRSGAGADLSQIQTNYKHYMDNWGKSIPYSQRTIENEIKLSLLLLDITPDESITGNTGLSPLRIAFSEDTYNTSSFAILM